MKIKKTGMEHFIAIPDFISLGNMSSGFLSIICAINNNLNLATIFIILAIIFDSIDGWTARKVCRNDIYGFGKNIDSLSDIISFGVAPAILLYISGINLHSPEICLIIVSLFIVICGVLRLTRYNVIADKTEFKGFIGFPIPGIAFILVSYYLSGLYNIYIAMILMIIVSILMISNVKYKKLDNIKIIAFALILILLMFMKVLIIQNINIAAIILLIITLYYLISNIFKNNN
ncbi:CDP-diacylglycerol--serine O-phosphatidyltransferase [Methanobrevibacter sp. 87.7]|uniref:archaetidylserine synthase n=1 Tax=Methanobrevibacter sp. 87.7 TaxID=387957 RepID=UPI000B500C3D|nr:archaetidylserine synthase [Methanobrevibacter sp. 87.7]OWT33148.1 CDP-diacylglycerol--serine O-phosphatidyltransferase [Methanobrevibacter sp. 87.7]